MRAAYYRYAVTRGSADNRHVEQDESTSEIAAANPITVGPGADNDIMLEQHDETLGETRVIWFDARHAEALAAAILAHAKVVRGRRWEVIKLLLRAKRQCRLP